MFNQMTTGPVNAHLIPGIYSFLFINGHVKGHRAGTIRIWHACEVRTEESVPMVTVFASRSSAD